MCVFVVSVLEELIFFIHFIVTFIRVELFIVFHYYPFNAWKISTDVPFFIVDIDDLCLFLCLARGLCVLLIFFKEPDFDFIHILYHFCFQFHYFCSVFIPCFLHALNLLCSSFLINMEALEYWFESVHLYSYLSIFILATLMSLIISTSVLASL